MTKAKKTPPRTTISLSDVVCGFADEMMEKKGYNNNFSAYVADLIRRDREREEEKQIILLKKIPVPMKGKKQDPENQ